MKRFARLLVVIDPSPEAPEPRGLEEATVIAEENGARITVFAVPERLPGLGRLLLRQAGRVEGLLEEGTRERLEALAEGTRARGIETDLVIGRGRLEDALVAEVARGAHDLVFLTVGQAPQRRVRRALLGSLPHRLLRTCPAAVFLAHPRRPARPDTPDETSPRILAAVDALADDPTGRALGRRVIEVAEDLAARGAGEAYACYAWTLPGESILRDRIPDEELAGMLDEARSRGADALEGLVDEALGEAAPRVRRRLVKGYPWDAVPALVDEIEADVLVIGSIARSGVGAALLGNTAESLVGHVACSMLVLDPDPDPHPTD